MCGVLCPFLCCIIQQQNSDAGEPNFSEYYVDLVEARSTLLTCNSGKRSDRAESWSARSRASGRNLDVWLERSGSVRIDVKTCVPGLEYASQTATGYTEVRSQAPAHDPRRPRPDW